MEMNVIQNMFPETFKAAGFSRHSLGSDGLHFSTFNWKYSQENIETLLDLQNHTKNNIILVHANDIV